MTRNTRVSHSLAFGAWETATQACSCLNIVVKAMRAIPIIGNANVILPDCTSRAEIHTSISISQVSWAGLIASLVPEIRSFGAVPHTESIDICSSRWA